MLLQKGCQLIIQSWCQLQFCSYFLSVPFCKGNSSQCATKNHVHMIFLKYIVKPTWCFQNKKKIWLATYCWNLDFLIEFCFNVTIFTTSKNIDRSKCVKKSYFVGLNAKYFHNVLDRIKIPNIC